MVGWREGGVGTAAAVQLRREDLAREPRDSQAHLGSWDIILVLLVGNPKKGQAFLEVFRIIANVVRALRLSLICPAGGGVDPRHSNILRAAASRHDNPSRLRSALNFCLQAPSSRFLFPSIPLEWNPTASPRNSDSGLARKAQEPQTDLFF